MEIAFRLMPVQMGLLPQTQTLIRDGPKTIVRKISLQRCLKPARQVHQWMITELFLLALPHSRLQTHSLPWTKSSILSLPQCSIYNTEVRLDQEDARRKVTRERNLPLNLRSFLLEGYRSCNETRALQDGSPVWVLWPSPEPPSCEPHVSITTVSLAPGTHGDQTSFVWAALKKGQIVAWIPRFCFSSPSAAAFLTGSWTELLRAFLGTDASEVRSQVRRRDMRRGSWGPGHHSIPWPGWLHGFSHDHSLLCCTFVFYTLFCILFHFTILKRHLKINPPNCF